MSDQYKLYVPDVDKWTRFYKLQAEGKLHPHFSVQRGGKSQTMYSVDRCLELYDPTWKKDKKEDKPSEPEVVIVSPTQQVVEQAKAQQRRLEQQSGKGKQKQQSGKEKKALKWQNTF